jgi:hypothetical protein
MTGFEKNNEPFGTFKPGSQDMRANGWKFQQMTKGIQNAGIIKEKHSNNQSMTPGSGNGKYGASFSKQIPETAASKLYLSFDLKINDPHTTGYLAFVYVFGNSDGSKKFRGRSVNMLVYPGKLVFPGNIVVPFSAKAGWTNFQFAINFKNSSFDCTIDGKILQRNIPFRSAGVANIKSITFGGGSPKTLTSYDNIYVGTTPPDKQTASILAPPALPMAAINSTAQAPAIDGKLDDACWKYSSELTPFFLPSGKQLAEKQSSAMVCYDKENLYIAMKCFEPRLHPALNQLDLIKTTKKQRDSAVWQDDSVEIFIRPDMTSGKYFQIAVNSAGTLFDSALPSPGASWQSSATVKTSRNTKYWSVEMAIPLKTLVQDTSIENQSWQMNFCRNRTNPLENSCWAPTFGRFNTISRFGKIVFSHSIPAVTLEHLPAKIAKGNNSLRFKFFSPQKSNLILQNSVKYGHYETVVNTSAVRLPSNQAKKAIGHFIYYPDTANRENAKNTGLSYTVFKKNGTLIYNSPWIQYPVAQDSALKTSFIAQTSRLLTKEIESLYINKGGARTVYLLIQAAKNVINKLDKVTTIIELPDSVEIINPLNGSRKAASPDSFKVQVISKNGNKYNRYEIVWSKKYVYPKGAFSRNNTYRYPLLLVMHARDNIKIGNHKLTMYSKTKLGSKTIQERPSVLPLTILNAINGKAPKKFPVITWGTKNNLIYTSLNSAEQKVFLANRIKAGFNILGLNELGGSYLSEQEQNNLRNYGFALVGAIPRNSPRTYTSNAFPQAESFLKAHPEYRAHTFDGKKLPDCICITELLNPAGKYSSEFKTWLGALANKYKYLVWDYEVTPYGKSSTCWCDRCRKKFTAYIKAPSSAITPAIILKEHKNAWIKFQCKRNAALAKIMSDIIKNASPSCKFSVYSGYQSQHTNNSYGVDWAMMKNAIDFAMCGYGRPLSAINATLQAINPGKLIGGLLIFVWYNSSYDMDNIKIDLYRRLTDSRGGVMLFYDIQADGRMWSAVAEMTGLISDHEELFLNCERDDQSTTVVKGKTENITVLKGKNGKRIVFIFNPSLTKTDVKLKISGKLYNVSLSPKDVKTLVIK